VLRYSLIFCSFVGVERLSALIGQRRPDLGIKMREPTLKFAVTCPDCALESLSEIPIAVIANALLTGKSIRLHAGCHDQYWTATFVEREQLRKTLATMKTDAPHTTKNHAKPNPQFETIS
jgi:hypothetical protein